MLYNKYCKITNAKGEEMKRGKRIALITGLSISLVLGSSIVFVKNSRIFAQDFEYQSDKSLSLVNNERSKHGLNALNWNSKLYEAAEKKANDIFEKNYFDHTSPEGAKVWSFILDSGYSYKTAGENLAVEFNNVEQAVDAWKQSPTHMANILSGKFSDYALYEKEGELDGKSVKVYVQLFGSK